MQELPREKGKDECSVDRCDLLSDRNKLLKDKAFEIANPSGNREPFGYSVGKAVDIRSIKSDVISAQAFEIQPAPITGTSENSKPWDMAHALIRKFDSNSTRSRLRGSRDKLTNLFSVSIMRFE